MLHLASFLQHLHPDFQEELRGLSESPQILREGLAGKAVSLVTTSDSRWAFIGQGARVQYKVLHPETKAYPHFMWFRIVYYDQMCLMLGMPQGTIDRSMASDEMLVTDSAIGPLERTHCVIASGESKGSPALFWEMRRLSEQLFLYNLLNQLHLPYMLLDSTERKYDYSRITCVNASREILSRFIMLRRWNQVAFSCHTVDFTALMAAMTLLLAHLDSHRPSQVDNFLAAQYLGDRAMIEQAQENMEELNRLNSDTLSARSAQLLNRLLAIEAKAAEGDLQSAQSPTPGPVIIPAEPEAETHTQPISLPTSLPSDSYNNHYCNKTHNNVTALFAPLLSEVLSDDPMQQFEHPGAAARIEDDVFEDLDLTFLDHLMRGTGDGQDDTDCGAA
ncbi:hypothetical protein N7491_002696 [Penicillium cf. griseofulvum]|uniref:Transcription factor domain-containing protein n=1 Tax=Penicillium cf. griseofulvum TaxID=2972120 RepID=A0A9W9T271_9EURO|nr:hypothetical protein N7472_003137 [Penicillium cf. griseofulvum]KAJ5440290.1 hypothetical protein N7491_002696 [Penicillium cf. griseofulvum]KAJ5448338.1 hypothetical protein N7445_003159 [Penicillium cf. griseofulvum]